MQLYIDLGARPVWTCAPYQLPGRPGLGDHIIAGESNAVAFYNSVIGARTNKYGDFLDVACALTGKVPLARLHTDEGRAGQLVIDTGEIPDAIKREDIFYHLIGQVAGRLAGSRIPVIEGLPADASEDNLKAVSAAAAAAGGVEMWHGTGNTPEAPTTEAALQGKPPAERHNITVADLAEARAQLTTGSDGPLNMVALGTPHFSPTEFAELAPLLANRRVHSDTKVYVATSRFVRDLAAAQGHIAPLEEAGVEIITDTCTYFSPKVRGCTGRAMTNAAKWAYYAPGMLGIEVCFGSLAECAESAVRGEVWRDERLWQPFETKSERAAPPPSPPLPPEGGESEPAARPGSLSPQGRGLGRGVVRRDAKLTRRAKQLRQDQTEPEKRLWSKLRRKQLNDHHFYRQKTIAGYIADFACPRQRLVVELDGWTHGTEDEIAYDGKHDEALAREGYTVIRISNNDVMTNLDGVVETIAAVLDGAPPPSPPLPPEGGESRPLSPQGRGPGRGVGPQNGPQLLTPGTASAATLILDEPLSFWGGYDPATGIILDQHHPQAAECVKDRILVLPGARGSGGTPACIAESIRRRVGPAGVVLKSADINIATGTLVAQALYDIACPVVTVDASTYDSLTRVSHLTIHQDGTITTS